MYSREVWILFCGMSALTLAAALGGGLLWGIGPALALALLGVLLSCVALAFTLRRYQKIADLSRYLAGVYAGGEAADIRDQRPGELGALKDDLYKITVLLRRQAADLARQKEFLARTLEDIAHQLKTPLAAVLASAELLAEEDLTPAQQEKAQTILRRAGEMQQTAARLRAMTLGARPKARD